MDRRMGLPLRVVAVVGVVCAASVAVATPAVADDGLVAGTPCSASARACVDLQKQKAWLIDQAGKVTLGPVSITSGGPGKETPVGTFFVQWKDKAHRSQEFRLPSGQGAPMPYSVFFADGGVAFHGGSLRRASAGCVHLSDPDAQTFYNTLQLGDEVQVHNGQAAAKPAPKPTSTPAPPPNEDPDNDDDAQSDDAADSRRTEPTDAPAADARRGDRRSADRRPSQPRRVDDTPRAPSAPNPGAGAQAVGGLMDSAYGQ
jgi:hypothetical protein